MGRADSDTLLQWGGEVIGSHAEGMLLTPIAGDASSRRYFRLQAGAVSYVLVDAPPATEKNSEFIAIQRLLSTSGLRVPKILAVDQSRGFMLLEDLGSEPLLAALDAGSVDVHYAGAFDLLLRFTRIDVSRLARYDDALLSEELGRFGQWFIEGLLQYRLSAGERAALETLDALLIDNALAQPRVFVHRDFHSRNLMLTGGELALIDFQDAVAGPLTYDLVSLLRDCYVRWPAPAVMEWARRYRRQLLDSTALPIPAERLFLRWFDLMGLQRHIKVLGTFARLYLRDGKAAYLQDLPLVVAYVRQVLARYATEEPACAQVSSWFDSTLLPLIEAQPWWQGTGAGRA